MLLGEPLSNIPRLYVPKFHQELSAGKAWGSTAFLHFWVGIIYWYDTMGYDITLKERDLGDEKVAEKKILTFSLRRTLIVTRGGDISAPESTQ